MTKAALLARSKLDHTWANVDQATLKLVARIPVSDDPHEVVASADGKTACVSKYSFDAFRTLTSRPPTSPPPVTTSRTTPPSARGQPRSRNHPKAARRPQQQQDRRCRLAPLRSSTAARRRAPKRPSNFRSALQPCAESVDLVQYKPAATQTPPATEALLRRAELSLRHLAAVAAVQHNQKNENSPERTKENRIAPRLSEASYIGNYR